MAKNSDAGCAPLIVVGVILFALGKCVGGPEPEGSSPQGLFSAPTEAALAVTSLYVQTRSLNCRASPSRKSAIVTKYAHGQEVGITDYSGDWRVYRKAAPMVAGLRARICQKARPLKIPPQ